MQVSLLNANMGHTTLTNLLLISVSLFPLYALFGKVRRRSKVSSSEIYIASWPTIFFLIGYRYKQF